MGAEQVLSSGGDVVGAGQSRRIVGALKVGGVLALALLGWATVVGYGVLAGWWHRALAPAGDTPAFMALRAPRASTGQPTAIAVGHAPGSRWKSSCGGSSTKAGDTSHVIGVPV